jgi:hypothetical protein
VLAAGQQRDTFFEMIVPALASIFASSVALRSTGWKSLILRRQLVEVAPAFANSYRDVALNPAERGCSAAGFWRTMSRWCWCCCS